MSEVWGRTWQISRGTSYVLCPGEETRTHSRRLTVGSKTEKFIELVEINENLPGGPGGG